MPTSLKVEEKDIISSFLYIFLFLFEKRKDMGIGKTS